MLGTEHQRRFDDARVGQPAQDVIEKRAAEGHHRLQAGIGSRRLLSREPGAAAPVAHPRAETAGEHDGARGAKHLRRVPNRAGDARASGRA